MSDAQKIVHRIDQVMVKIARGFAYLSGILLALLAVFIFVDVLSRRFLGVSSGGTDEITGLFAAVIISGAFAYTFYSGDHISIDIFTTKYSPKVRKYLALFGYLLLSGFAVITAFALWQVLSRSLSGGTVTVSLGIPIAPFQIYVVAAMVLLAIGCLVRVVHVIVNRVDLDEEEAAQ